MPTPSASARPRLRSTFAAGAGLALVAVLLLGWFTSLRGVMHTLLLVLGAKAPLPFLAALGLGAVLAAAALASVLLVDAAAPARLERAALGGSGFARAFLAQVRRQERHPSLWGAGSGAALGLVGIWLVLAALVVPLDMGSLDLLLFSKVRIDAAHRAGKPAAASPDGLLHPSAWNGSPEAGDAAVADGFGRPIHLKPDPAGGYELRSLGLDGTASVDDLCVRGPDPLALPLAGLPDALAFLERRRVDGVGPVAQVSALLAARCAAAR